MIDCGTIPHKNGIYYFHKALSSDPNVAGVCGRMGVRFWDNLKENTSKLWKLSALAISCAQDFEYTIAHILDKSFESFFG